MNDSDRTVHILLVEDDEIDAEQVVRSFRQANVANPIKIAIDGIEALNVLRGEEGYERLPRPYIILLDINMPRMNGLELLRELRTDAELKRSIVFVLTTSASNRDMEAAYEAHAAGYFLKHHDPHTNHLLPELIASYWRMARLPVDD